MDRSIAIAVLALLVGIGDEIVSGDRDGPRDNFLAHLKQYRAIATRYDKTARNFLGAIYLAATVIWLNSLMTRPSRKRQKSDPAKT